VTAAQDGRNRQAFWDFVAKLPCVVCYDAFYLWLLKQDSDVYVNLLLMVQQLTETSKIQLSRTEVAHMGRWESRRGISQRYPWREVWPLCGGHHREFKTSHHAGTAAFWAKHPKLDRDGIIDLLLKVHAARPFEVTL
jgi:hypothetical protein